MDITFATILVMLFSNVAVQHADKLEAAATFDPECKAKFVKQADANYGYDSVEHCPIRKSSTGVISIERTKKA